MRKRKEKNYKNAWLDNVAIKLNKDESGIYKLVGNKKEYIYLFEGRI